MKNGSFLDDAALSALPKGQYVYILECSDGTLYTGWTTDAAHRLAVHNSGKGARYTRARLPVRMVYLEVCADRSEAQKREAAIKRLSRREKEELIDAFTAGGRSSLTFPV